MKLHRYFVDGQELTQEFWIKDVGQYHQWTKVLRYDKGREVVLFNSSQNERMYRIEQIGEGAVKLEMITQLEPSLPKTEVYLCFAMLKKDKNDWVLQKATELGVSHFVPLLTERTEKTGWNQERAEKIVVEAAEQCGRTDIPRLREPITPQKIIEELRNKAEIFIAEQGSSLDIKSQIPNIQNGAAILIGPEGGWSDAEKELFKEAEIKHLALSEFTLRAETACIAAATLLQ